MFVCKDLVCLCVCGVTKITDAEGKLERHRGWMFSGSSKCLLTPLS